MSCHISDDQAALGIQRLPASVAGPWEALRGEDRGFRLGLMPSKPRSGENPIEASGDWQVPSAPSVKGSRDPEEGSSEEAEQVKNASRLPWRGWEGEERAGSDGIKGRMLSQQVTLPVLVRMGAIES